MDRVDGLADEVRQRNPKHGVFGQGAIHTVAGRLKGGADVRSHG